MEPGPYIQTVSGRRFNPLDPDPTEIDVGDVALALSHQCRFGGHCRTFYCPTPEQRVLTADLRWVAAGDLTAGDELLGFDEVPRAPGSAGNRRRRYRLSHVVSTRPVKRRVVRLEMSDGATVAASAEHPWLVATKQSRNQRWVTAQDLAVALRAGRRRYMHRFLDTWGSPSSWREGWLAGMLDGERYLSIANRKGVQFGIAQRPGPALVALERAIGELGFGAYRYSRTGDHAVITLQIVGGWRRIAKLIGSVRPLRLTEKFVASLRSGEFAKQMDGLGEPSQIVAAYNEGEQWVAGLETSTHTYLCEGYAAHNSVAQHSCLVADLVEEGGGGERDVLWALLHDASEAYLVDLPHPLKHRSELGRLYAVAEEKLQAAICERFGLAREPPALLKQADRALLATERREVAQVAWEWPELDGVVPLDLEIEPWPPERARAEFLARYERIRGSSR